MNLHAKRIAIAAAFVLASAGSAFADSGDNSMSPWTGDSYAAFNGGNVGAPQREPTEVAKHDEAKENDAERKADVIIGLPREHPNPFRDDTAA